jgi:hypothetical protein
VIVNVFTDVWRELFGNYSWHWCCNWSP